MNTFHHSDGERMFPGLPQQNPNVDPPPSPWSPAADPNEMLSDSVERFDPSGLGGIFDDSREPSVSTGNNEHNEEDISDVWSWHYDTEEGEEHLDRYITVSSDSLATDPMDSGSFGGNFHSDTTHADSGSRDVCAEMPQAMEEPLEFFTPTGVQPKPGSLIGLGMPTNDVDAHPPSIVVSGATTDENPINVQQFPKSYDSATIPTSRIENERFTVHSPYRPVASNQQSGVPPDPKKYRPNNYDIATHDRQIPIIPGGINPRSEKTAADNVAAFFADADLTVANAAATTPTDTNLNVERGRLSENLPVFQTKIDLVPSFQHRQSLPRTPQTSSIFQSSPQALTYLTPPSSFTEVPKHQHLDSVHTTGNSPSTQSSSSRNSSMGPPSPSSLSPSDVPETTDSGLRCPECPNAVFGGTTANQKSNLRRHHRDHHCGSSRLECLIQGCPITFAPGRKDNQLKHVRATHPEYPLPPQKKRKRESDTESYS